MAVEPLFVVAEEGKPLSIMNLGVTCSTVNVTAPVTPGVNISVDYIRVLSAPGVDMTTCVAPCTPSGIIVKWRNDGDTEGTFVPKVIVTNVDTNIQTELLSLFPSLTIAANSMSSPMGIYLPTLGVGTYTFCPIENPGNVCVTVNVTSVPPPSEGGGAIIFVGLALLGMMMTAKKK